jgi:hypothetical protein
VWPLVVIKTDPVANGATGVLQGLEALAIRIASRNFLTICLK